MPPAAAPLYSVASTRTLVVSIVLLAALAVPAAASADVLLSGFWGRNYKTRLGENVDGDANPIDNHSTWGGALAILGGRGFGIEVDVGHVPDFFTPDDLEFDVLDSNHVTTVMGNLLLIGGSTMRAYLTGGAGIVRSKLGDFGELIDTTTTDFGWNAGGGIIGGSRRFSVRGDFRYFGTVGDSDGPLFEDPLQGNISFWRGTLGLTLGF